MISIVIVTHNSEACVSTCLKAVATLLPDAERLVVDNASTDGSRAAAERQGATVVGLDKNLGFGRACNIGARRARHDHILFLNPDVVIRSADVTGLHALIGESHLGLIVPTSTTAQFIFAERPWVRETLYLILKTLRPRELPRSAPSSHAGRTVWASGAALLIRKAEFLGIGGFDSRYFLYYEDRDLSWKYRERGLPLRPTSALVADHVGGSSSELSDRRSNIGAFAIMGWVEYRSSTCGRGAATRSWILARRIHAVITRTMRCIARVIPSARLHRKSLQLTEVAHELEKIRASSGVLQQSDAHRYWPNAVAVLVRSP